MAMRFKDRPRGSGEDFGLEETSMHEILDRGDDPVVLGPTFSAEMFSRVVEYPIIVQSWSKAVGPNALGSFRRKFHERFNEEEREILGHYHQMFRKWHSTEGTPHRITLSLSTLNLLQRAVAFFADPDRKPRENPEGEMPCAQKKPDLEVLGLLKQLHHQFETREWINDERLIARIHEVVRSARRKTETPELKVLRRISEGLRSQLDVKGRYSHEVRFILRSYDPKWMKDRGWNPGEKRPFIVNIHDRDMQREMDIETWAVSPRKAEANGWFRLMKMEDFTGAVGVFRKRYGERYVIRVRE